MAEIMLSVAVLAFIIAGILVCIIAGTQDSPVRRIREAEERALN